MLTEQQIEVAAAWWSSAIDGQPKFDNLGPTRGQDAEETRMNTVASMLASMLASASLPSPESLLAFEEALKTGLRKIDDDPPYVSVDYHPDRILADAADAVGIDGSRFPWKTTMRFDHGGVQVAHGYGAAFQELLAKGSAG